jgi:hypothetical protein
MENNIFISPSDYHFSDAKGKNELGLGIECIVNRKDTVYLGNTPDEIAKKLFDIDVDTVTYSSCMEFATEYGFKNNDDAEKLFNASWSKYESMLKSKNALEQFNKIQSTITSEVK